MAAAAPQKFACRLQVKAESAKLLARHLLTAPHLCMALKQSMRCQLSTAPVFFCCLQGLQSACSQAGGAYPSSPTSVCILAGNVNSGINRAFARPVPVGAC